MSPKVSLTCGTKDSPAACEHVIKACKIAGAILLSDASANAASVSAARGNAAARPSPPTARLVEPTAKACAAL